MIFRPFKALFRWHARFLLAALTVVPLLAACQNGSTPPTETAEVTPSWGTPEVEVTLPATETPTPEPTPTLPEHLTVASVDVKDQVVIVWHPWQGDLEDRFNAAVDEFNRANEWSIRVQPRPLYSTGELYSVVSAGLTGETGELPQVVVATSDQLAAWNDQPGTMVDLSGYFEHTEFGLTADELQAFQPAFLEQDQAAAGDVQLGLPALRSAQVLFYNTTWAKELGFNLPPRTTADFKQQACAAAVVNNSARDLEKYGTGGWLIDTGALTTLSWLTAFSANPLPAVEGQPYRFESEAAQKALAFLRDLQDSGCAWLPRSTGAYENFSRRKALFYTGTLPDLAVQKGWQERLHSADEWTVIPFPGEDGSPVLYAYGYSYGLIRAPQPETQTAAWLFVRWMSQPENAVRLAEALPSLPISSGVTARLSDAQSNFPWYMVLPLTDEVRPAPGFASWREVRRLLEDASWQIYHLPVEGLPQILPQLDGAVRELSTQAE